MQKQECMCCSTLDDVCSSHTASKTFLHPTLSCPRLPAIQQTTRSIAIRSRPLQHWHLLGSPSRVRWLVEAHHPDVSPTPRLGGGGGGGGGGATKPRCLMPDTTPLMMSEENDNNLKANPITPWKQPRNLTRAAGNILVRHWYTAQQIL